ncbi:strictosidine synthase [Castellaniella sp.]|uniref:strictosidine synthase n=1 Tax=Castellaniella sp. TaxID=1955812 RepID=UPI00355E62BD
MTPFWRRLADRLLGRGDSAVTVPAMDGALQPNTLLDEARVLETVPEPDNLVAWQGELLYTSGADIRRAGQDEPLYRLPAPAASLAAWHDEILLAGLEDGSLLVCAGPHEGRHHVRWQAGRPMVCPTALWLQDARTVLVAEGSSRNGPADWQLDLMQKNALGSVWRLDLDTGQATLLADRLAWPAGLADAGDAGVLVSESWRHRLIGLSGQPGTSASEVLGDLPAYPGRISPSPQGGFWLALYAPRSQLVELVLRETRYRNDMLRELERDHWICPALSGKRSFREPLQRGGLKQMGILKPWAPSRSYGLALYLDAGLNPMHGKHSRADGQRHGITSLLEQHGVLYATSRGGHMILAMEP